MKQTLVEGCLITQQDQPLGIGVQPSDGIELRRKAELRQRSIGRAIRGELGDHPIGFMKGDKHAGQTMATSLTKEKPKSLPLAISPNLHAAKGFGPNSP